MTEEQKEKLGQEIDRLDSLAEGLQIPMDAKTHVDCLKRILPDVVSNFKQLFYEATGENPWEAFFTPKKTI